MAYGKGVSLIIFSFFLFHYAKTATVSVPLLAWGTNNRNHEMPSVLAGHTKKLADVYKEHVEPLIKSKSVVLVFLQDEFSADDFTKYASSFSHLQNTLQKENYMLFPSVAKEDEEMGKLIGSSSKGVEYVDSGSISEWKYKKPVSNDHANIIVFHLEPVSGSHLKGKEDILKKNDLTIHRVVKSLREEIHDFGVIFTAEDPSSTIANILLEESIEDSTLASRHLLEDKKSEAVKFFNNTCVLFYLSSFRFEYSDKTVSDEFIEPEAEWKVGGCGSKKSGCSISITREGKVGNYSNVTLFIGFKYDDYEWYCDLLRISGKREDADFSSDYNCSNMNPSGIAPMVPNTILAPLRMSYACQNLEFRNNQNITLFLGGAQLETMCEDQSVRTQFSPAYNCVGFFTIEILTGIFVTILLLAGLFFGIMMMMAIQVQDRLDDPKGKTITVPTHTE